MRSETEYEGVVRDLLVPRALLPKPDAFGGSRATDCQRGDVLIRKGRVVAMRANDEDGPPRGLLMPRLCEPHVHLDKCHTIGRIGKTGGSLQDAIAAQTEDKANWTEADLRHRTRKGLEELAAAGCGLVRSHVDWPHAEEACRTPNGWHVLKELAEEKAGEITLNLSVLIGVETFTRPEFCDWIGALLSGTGHAVGCFVFDQPKRREGIVAAFRTAHRFDLALDFHVDEGLKEGLDGLEIIAQAAIETGFEGPILCGHACSLMNATGETLSRRLDLVAEAGIAIAALPSTNLYLQDRSGGTPDRRGITRLQELEAAGIPTLIGTDNVADAFCPLNRHDPRYSLSLAALGVHLDPPYGDHLHMITTTAEKALGAPGALITDRDIADLLVFAATGTADFLTGTDRPKPFTSLPMEQVT